MKRMLIVRSNLEALPRIGTGQRPKSLNLRGICLIVMMIMLWSNVVGYALNECTSVYDGLNFVGYLYNNCLVESPSVYAVSYVDNDTANPPITDDAEITSIVVTVSAYIHQSYGSPQLLRFFLLNERTDQHSLSIEKFITSYSPDTVVLDFSFDEDFMDDLIPSDITNLGFVVYKPYGPRVCVLNDVVFTITYNTSLSPCS